MLLYMLVFIINLSSFWIMYLNIYLYIYYCIYTNFLLSVHKNVKMTSLLNKLNKYSEILALYIKQWLDCLKICSETFPFFDYFSYLTAVPVLFKKKRKRSLMRPVTVYSMILESSSSCICNIFRSFNFDKIYYKGKIYERKIIYSSATDTYNYL